jgi:hypothetical protein
VEELLLLAVEYTGINDVRQSAMQTVEPLVYEPSISDVQIANEKLKSYKSPDHDQIPAEMIQARGNTVHSEI